MGKKSKEYRANSRKMHKEQEMEKILMERREFHREKRITHSPSPIKRLQRYDRPRHIEEGFPRGAIRRETEISTTLGHRRRGSPPEESFYQMREIRERDNRQAYREGSLPTRTRKLSPGPPMGYRGNAPPLDSRGHPIEYHIQGGNSREALRMPVPYDHRFAGAPPDRHVPPETYRERLRSPVGRKGDPRYEEQTPINGRGKVSPAPVLPPVSPVKLIYSAGETGRLLPPLSVRKAIIMGNQPKTSFPPPTALKDKKIERPRSDFNERKVPVFDDLAVNRKREVQRFEDHPVRHTVASRVIRLPSPPKSFSRPTPDHSPMRRMRPMEGEDHRNRPPAEYIRGPPGHEFEHPRRIPLRRSPSRRSPLRKSPPRSPPSAASSRRSPPRPKPTRRSRSPPRPMFVDSPPPPRKRSWIDESSIRNRPLGSPYREEDRPRASVEKRRGPPLNFDRDRRLSRGRSPPMEFRRSLERQWPKEHSPRGRRSVERSPRGRRSAERSPRGRRSIERSPRGRRLDEHSPRRRRSAERSPLRRRSAERSPLRRRSAERSPRGCRLEEPISRGHRPEEQIPYGGRPENFIPRGRRPDDHIPRGHMPEEHFPRGRRPVDHIPRGRIPEDHIPRKRIPEDHIPRKRIPEEHFLRARIPEEHIPRGRRFDEHIPQGRRPEEYIPRGRRMEEDGIRRRPY